jgi:hypothetical protein
VHPAIQSGLKRPDFLAVTGGGEQFYCEAVVAFDASDAEAGAQSRLNDLHDALNQTESPNFFIDLDTDGEPERPLPIGSIRKATEQFLRELDPDEIAAQLNAGAEISDLPVLRLAYHGCTIEIRGLPKSPSLRGISGVRPLGLIGMGARFVDDARATREAAIKKATRYGNLGHAYLIAVNAQSQHLGHTDMMAALFGTETFLLSSQLTGSSEPEMDRKRNGLWNGPKGSRYTRVSAVLIGSSILPWSVAASTPWLFHNPWASRPLSDALDVLPHARAIPSESRMDFREGIAASDLFGLPPNWGDAE